MSRSLKKGFLAIALSALALGAISSQASNIRLGGETEQATGSRMMDVPELKAHEASVDEQRIEQLQGEDESFRFGICSVTCAPCSSSASCPPFDGQQQQCWFNVACP